MSALYLWPCCRRVAACEVSGRLEVTVEPRLSHHGAFVSWWRWKHLNCTLFGCPSFTREGRLGRNTLNCALHYISQTHWSFVAGRSSCGEVQRHSQTESPWGARFRQSEPGMTHKWKASRRPELARKYVLKTLERYRVTPPSAQHVSFMHFFFMLYLHLYCTFYDGELNVEVNLVKVWANEVAKK